MNPMLKLNLILLLIIVIVIGVIYISSKKTSKKSSKHTLPKYDEISNSVYDLIDVDKIENGLVFSKSTKVGTKKTGFGDYVHISAVFQIGTKDISLLEVDSQLNEAKAFSDKVLSKYGETNLSMRILDLDEPVNFINYIKQIHDIEEETTDKNKILMLQKYKNTLEIFHNNEVYQDREKFFQITKRIKTQDINVEIQVLEEQLIDIENSFRSANLQATRCNDDKLTKLFFKLLKPGISKNLRNNIETMTYGAR